MRVLLSGEGPSDMGQMEWTGSSQRFRPGPMGVMVEQLLRLSEAQGDSIHFVHKAELGAVARPIRLPGAKNPGRSAYHFKSAMALGHLALQETAEGQVVAVLFRDCDGTQSTARGDWQKKFDSVADGFAAAGFDAGVPMVPRPKSEAWMLCGLKESPYQNCDALEEESGNDASPRSLKRQLAGRMGGELDSEEQADLVRNRTVDVARIEMESFTAFRMALMANVRTL